MKVIYFMALVLNIFGAASSHTLFFECVDIVAAVVAAVSFITDYIEVK